MPPVDYQGNYAGPPTLGARPPEPRPLTSPGLVETSLLSLRTGLTGLVSFDLLPSIADSIFLGERDPDFDPWSSAYFNEEFLLRHPSMLEAYRRGIVDDVPNSFAFSRMVDRMDDDFRARERLGQAGVMTQIAGGILGNPHELLIGGVLARGAALSTTLRSVSGWAAKGGYMQRAVIGAAAGAGENFAYDIASRSVSNPMAVNQEFDPLSTVLIGATFGGIAASIGSGVQASGRGLSRLRLESMKRHTAEAVTSPTYRNAVEAAQADLEGLRAVADELDATYRAGTSTPPAASTGVSAMGAAPPNIDPGMLFNQGAPPRRLTVLRTPETAPAIDAMKAKYGSAIEFDEHPMQELADLARELDGIETAPLGRVGEAALGLFNVFLPNTKRLTHAPGSLAKLAARTFWDFNRPTAAQLDDPINASVNSPPAEGERWRLDGYHKTWESEMDALYREWRSDRAGRSDDFMMNRDAFHEAVTAEMRAIDELNRGQRTGHAQEPLLARAVEATREYNNRIAREMNEVGMLDADVSGPDNFYVMRRWNADAVRRSRDVFKDRLILASARNREVDFRTGKAVVPADRPLEKDAVVHKRRARGPNDRGLSGDERDAIAKQAEQAGKKVEELTERDLSPELLSRYLEEIEIWHDRRADSFIDTLLLPDRAHGVESAFTTPGVTKRRIIEVNESDFSEFLDGDIRAIVGAYHAKLSGRLAMRQAIRASAKQWAPWVKTLLGKDLKTEGYDPLLIQQVVEKDMGMWINAANNAGDTRRVAQLEKGLERWKRAFESKVAELERRDTDVGIGKSALWRFTKRQLMKGPYLAYMGKMAVAQITDLAATMSLSRMPRKARAELVRYIGSIRKMSRADREMFLVGIEDSARSIFDTEVGDFATANARNPFGKGRAGAMMAAGDKATDWAMDKFTRLTGIRPVTRILKEMSWHKAGQEIIADARLMAKAKALRDAGKSVDEALAGAGLSTERAAILNRAGLDGANAVALLEQIGKHGLDYEGNPIKSIEHDGYIHMNASAWADSKPDLWRRLQFAVESRVRDVALQPKILSLPLKTEARPFLIQFQSFMFAFGRQQLPYALHSGRGATAQLVMYSLALSAIVDAIYNQLSGRRDIGETIQQWQSNPAGMMYGAVLRSPLLGVLQRPLGMMEYRMSPLRPAKLLGNDKISAMYGRRDMTVGDLMGPSASWLNNIFAAFGTAVEKGNYSPSTNRQMWNAMPFHNLWLLDGANRIGEWLWGEPVVGPNSETYNR